MMASKHAKRMARDILNHDWADLEIEEWIRLNKHEGDKLKSLSVVDHMILAGCLRDFVKRPDVIKKLSDQEHVIVHLELYCPMCHARHIDKGVWAFKRHHTHSCQKCGHSWRPAVPDTLGVQFLPGFKSDE